MIQAPVKQSDQGPNYGFDQLPVWQTRTLHNIASVVTPRITAVSILCILLLDLL
jgi:hypothetical protein